ncbi:aspartic proteinase CDR1 [Quercus suber]|uniref:Aspartic proteinase nepenthesin-1 n=1 Tax=Quercus suber TaxID=58331 RepID=A0AAW0KP78_QUESU
MAVLFNLFLLSCFTLLCFTTSTTSLATTSPTITKPKRLVTKLIHHNSVYSPYYNPKDTIADRARHAIDGSNARSDYIWKKIQGVSLDTDDVRAGVIAETKHEGFMANISIGSPPVPQLLVMDTGSGLLWTQCQPCTHCFTQALPIFNPPESSTYSTLPCTSPSCYRAPGSNCQASHCAFKQGYIDGTSVSGFLGTEKFTFETSDEGITSIPNLVLGCANSVAGFGGQSSGILGLAADKISLVNQVGTKFSYCFGPIRDPQYSHNQLIFGDGAIIQGSSTPIEILAGLYFLTLESISVGEKKLDILPEVFTMTPAGKGGVMIDSAPCFNGVINRDLVGFPVVTFNFANGVDLALDVESLFIETSPNQFCMAVLPSIANDMTIIGVMAQQNYNIAYDLAGNSVSMERIDCELLES